MDHLTSTHRIKPAPTEKGTFLLLTASDMLSSSSILFTENKRDFYIRGIYCDSEGIVIALISTERPQFTLEWGDAV
jgi:hypothetical protein